MNFAMHLGGDTQTFTLYLILTKESIGVGKNITNQPRSPLPTYLYHLPTWGRQIQPKPLFTGR